MGPTPRAWANVAKKHGAGRAATPTSRGQSIAASMPPPTGRGIQDAPRG
jgi:hypothetical protein